MPGLIPGASQGRGLGLEFLRHVERCSVLVHVLDTATLESDRDPVTDLDIIEEELRQYGGLEDRPRIVVLNKVDIPDGQDLADMIRPDLEERGYQVFEASAVARLGLKELSFALIGIVAEARAAKPKEEATRIVIRPKAVDDAGFTVIYDEAEDVYRVRGEKPERWVRQTDFNNDEAVGYLADRLNRLGVEDRLMKAGARAGDGVAIGSEENAVVFDWEPSMMAGCRNARPPRRGPPPGGPASGSPAPSRPRRGAGRPAARVRRVRPVLAGPDGTPVRRTESGVPAGVTVPAAARQAPVPPVGVRASPVGSWCEYRPPPETAGRLSVVVIAYNDEALVGQAIRSALDQGPVVAEVVAVDDCSSDGTARVLDELAARHPRVRVVHRTENSGGCGSPRNDGIRASTAPYVMFLDSDDILPSGAAEALVAAAERHGTEVAVGVCVRRELPEGRDVRWQPALYREAAVLETPADLRPLVHDTLCVNKVYDRAFLTEHGILFPEGRFVYEDFLFTARVYAAAPASP